MDDTTSLEQLFINFDQELLELQQDIELVEAFGYEKFLQVTFLSPVKTFSDLPENAPPNTCAFVEDELASYLFDGIGWVMFGGQSFDAVTIAVTAKMTPDWMPEAIAQLDAQIAGQDAWVRMVELLETKPSGPRVLSSRTR